MSLWNTCIDLVGSQLVISFFIFVIYATFLMVYKASLPAIAVCSALELKTALSSTANFFSSYIVVDDLKTFATRRLRGGLLARSKGLLSMPQC